MTNEEFWDNYNIKIECKELFNLIDQLKPSYNRIAKQWLVKFVKDFKQKAKEEKWIHSRNE